MSLHINVRSPASASVADLRDVHALLGELRDALLALCGDDSAHERVDALTARLAAVLEVEGAEDIPLSSWHPLVRQWTEQAVHADAASGNHETIAYVMSVLGGSVGEWTAMPLPELKAYYRAASRIQAQRDVLAIVRGAYAVLAAQSKTSVRERAFRKMEDAVGIARPKPVQVSPADLFAARGWRVEGE